MNDVTAFSVAEDADHPTDTNCTLMECACCYRDILLTETTHCSAATPHRFCLDCARKYSETQIGKLNTELRCFDLSQCAASFAETEIRKFMDQKSYEGLENLRNTHAIKQANIEGLVHCPFCPFGAILDPEEDVFECLNCMIPSCRNCRVRSHKPLGCAEYQASNKLAAKHVVEEAMTNALVRKCNKCKTAFLKEEGCNKMTCRCGNYQCYVCSSNVVDYSHFQGYGDGNGCPLYGDMKDLLREQVAIAQEKTLQRLVNSDAGFEEADIRVDERMPINPLSAAAVPAIPQLEQIDQVMFMPVPWRREPRRAIQNINNRRMRTRDPEHICTECNKQFELANSLSQHCAAKGHKLNWCARCNKGFGAPYSLAQHQRDKHRKQATGTGRKKR